ncbi:hypothetical protein QQ045_024945 [Rhodiola kirilowii]
MAIRACTMQATSRIGPREVGNGHGKKWAGALWEGGPSKFPWTFTATETMYLLKGKVKVECEGHEGQFEIGAGDLVVFPNGMKVTWYIIEPVEKHFSLEE